MLAPSTAYAKPIARTQSKPLTSVVWRILARIAVAIRLKFGTVSQIVPSYDGLVRLLGNILWLILGGLLLAASWAIIGLVLCVTIMGIPLGIQAFKMAGLTLTPFGKTVVYGGGVGSVLANIVWFVLAGVWMAIGYVCAGLLNCVTIIGIPFGIQSFKMAKLALWPFGSQIRSL